MNISLTFFRKLCIAIVFTYNIHASHQLTEKEKATVVSQLKRSATYYEKSQDLSTPYKIAPTEDVFYEEDMREIKKIAASLKALISGNESESEKSLNDDIHSFVTQHAVLKFNSLEESSEEESSSDDSEYLPHSQKKMSKKITGELLFKCEACGKKFTRKASIVNHNKIHNRIIKR